MTMHLVHPSLTTTGKRRGKKKYRSAEAAQTARQNQQSWKDLKERWEVDTARKRNAEFKPMTSYRLTIPKDRDFRNLSGKKCAEVGNAFKAAVPVYTGDKIIGIGTLHKSNAVPIFSNEEAIEISRMRRG